MEFSFLNDDPSRRSIASSQYDWASYLGGGYQAESFSQSARSGHSHSRRSWRSSSYRTERMPQRPKAYHRGYQGDFLELEESRPGTPDKAPGYQQYGQATLPPNSAAEKPPPLAHTRGPLPQPSRAQLMQPDEDVESDKIAEEKRMSSVNAASAVPNGGLTAWLQVLGGFCLFFNTWGILNGFGEFQSYYIQSDMLKQSASNLSWIGSCQAFFLLMVGALTGPLYDAGYVRSLLVVGSFCIVFGHMMLSLVDSYWQAFLAQAAVVGIGAGCLFVPTVGIIATYFTTKLGPAIGIAAAGSSLGGIVYPIVLHKLIPQIGFGWTTRVVGFIALGTLIIPIAVMKQRIRPQGKRKLFDASAFKDVPFLIFVVGLLVGFMGLFVFFFYVSVYAEQYVHGELPSYLLPILNASSILGRTLPNLLGARIGPMNVLIPACALASITTFCMLVAHSSGALIATSLIFGVFSGAYVSLPPTILVRLTSNPALIGTRVGMGFTIGGLGVLAGGPGAGGIAGVPPNYNWTGMWVFGAAGMMASGVLFTIVRIMKSNRNWKAVV